MSRTISTSEFISTILLGVETVIGKTQVRISAIESDKYVQIKKQVEEELGTTRGAKGEAERRLLADKELTELREKLAVYEAYARYLKRLLDNLEKIHYTAKRMVDYAEKQQMKIAQDNWSV